MARNNPETKAAALVRSMGKRLIGRRVVTEAIGEWPGGVARVTELHPDPAAPDIVMIVRECGETEWGIGILAHETVRLIRQDVHD